MTPPVVLVGIGEMGGVFARGLLRTGHAVYPLTRRGDIEALAREIPAPALALVAVAEKDLYPVLDALPEPWRGRLGLLQNELLPADWHSRGIPDPTVVSVWFEKKPGQDFKVLIPSPVFGPGSGLICGALESLGIPTRALSSEQELLFELVVKNVYILTTNIAGLETGGTVSELWARRRDLAEEVAGDVIALQAALVGQELDSGRLIAAMLKAFDGDPDHKCTGRSAPDRLGRALEQALRLGVEVPALTRIFRNRIEK